jgi:hypothetical protein
MQAYVGAGRVGGCGGEMTHAGAHHHQPPPHRSPTLPPPAPSCARMQGGGNGGDAGGLGTSGSGPMDGATASAALSHCMSLPARLVGGVGGVKWVVVWVWVWWVRKGGAE